MKLKVPLILKVIYKAICTLIEKSLSTKGLFFFTMVILYLTKTLDIWFVFTAGTIWVGAREFYKHRALTNSVQTVVQTIQPIERPIPRPPSTPNEPKQY